MGHGDKVTDIEAGSGSSSAAGDPSQVLLYPAMTESPELRWAFVRKVYTILTFQLILTSAIAAVAVLVRPVSQFLADSPFGFLVTIGFGLISLILIIPLERYEKSHPLNLVFLFLFTIAVALMIGSFCATKKGKIVLEAAILTSVVVVSLTLYTFWAVKRGADFSYLGPFLCCSLMVILAFSLIQVMIPMEKLPHAIFSLGAALVFAGYIIYDTDSLIKRYTYDEYISASIALYLDIMNMFMYLLSAMADRQSSN